MRCRKISYSSLVSWSVENNLFEVPQISVDPVNSFLSLLRDDIVSILESDDLFKELLDLKILSIYTTEFTDLTPKIKIVDIFSGIDCIYCFRKDRLIFEYINRYTNDCFRIVFDEEVLDYSELKGIPMLQCILDNFKNIVLPKIKYSVLQSRFLSCFIASKRLSKSFGNDLLDLSGSISLNTISIRVLNIYDLVVDLLANKYIIVSLEEYRQQFPTVDLSLLELNSVDDWDKFLSMELEKVSTVM